MATVTSQDYGDGNKLIAGEVMTSVENLAADTYYIGMPLAYGSTPTAVLTGTGNGTMTVLSAGAGVEPGAWKLDFSAALVADLLNPTGTSVGTYALIDGAATVIEYEGLRFTVTDGATAFDATSLFTITVPATGVYTYTAVGPFDAFYNGSTKTLASAGYGSVVVGGEIYEGGIVDGANSALTITTAMRTQMRANGFYPRKVS